MSPVLWARTVVQSRSSECGTFWTIAGFVLFAVVVPGHRSRSETYPSLDSPAEFLVVWRADR